MPNLWPADIGTASVDAPLTLLREQARALSDMTGGLVVGRVRSTAVKRQIAHAFELEVPTMDGYTYTLFEVSHPPSAYPAKVSFPDGKADEYIGEYTLCVSYEGLEATVRQVLNHPVTRRIVGGLRANAVSPDD